MATSSAIYRLSLDARVAWNLRAQFPNERYEQKARECAFKGGYDSEDSYVPLLVAEVPELETYWLAGIAARQSALDEDSYYNRKAA